MTDKDAAQRAFARHDDFYDKLNETTVQSGTFAIRSIFILNGGACLALLAFAANTLTAEHLSAGQDRLVLQILGSLSLFAWGAFAAVATSGLAYLSNRLGVMANHRMTKHDVEPYLRKDKVAKAQFYAANTLQVFAILTAVASLILFIWALLTVARNIPTA